MCEQLNMDQLFGEKITSFGEPHLACALLLDTSFSMDGEPIDNLMQGLKRFKESVSADPVACKRVDVALIAFNSQIQVISDFVPISKMPIPTLQARGMTNMAEAIHTAIDLVKKRTKMYQDLGTPCHKPWIFLITDGISTSNAVDMKSAATRIREEEERGTHGRLSFWVLGIDGYDPSAMFELTPRVLELKDENFEGIFDWLSESMSAISQSHVGDHIEFSTLPENARKAQPDRCINEGWY